MTTLTVMKARITSELRRSNITTQIASAISTAISALESERFYFNESRVVNFDTVADQQFYDGDDSAYIPRLVKIDYVQAEIDSNFYDLTQKSPAEIESLNGDGSFTGQPISYCYYGEQIRIYPVPADAYTIRIGAVITMPEPATDGEADNPWMTKAERAVRCRAKYELYEHVLLDTAGADRYHPENEGGPTYEAMAQLRRRTNNLTQQGGWAVTPTDF